MNKCIIKEVAIEIGKSVLSFIRIIAVGLTIFISAIVLLYVLGYSFCYITGVYPAIESSSATNYYVGIGTVSFLIIAAIAILVLCMKGLVVGIIDIYRDAKRNCNK